MRHLMGAALIAAGIGLSLQAMAATQPAKIHEATPAAAKVNGNFSFEGPFGAYDTAALQTGFAVYQANCASCHGTKLMRYSDLGQIGLSPKDVAAITAAIKRPDGVGAKGKTKMVAAKPDDTMIWSYPNRQVAAAANHGAVPPDLSLFEAGRRHGARYVQALLNGYRPAPPNLTLLPDHYYNIAFPGGQIAMPPSLKAGSVTLADGKKPSQEQMAHDVAEFLAWTADPNMGERKSVGLRAILVLLVIGGLGFFVLRRNRSA